MTIEEKLEKLLTLLREMESVVVAFSGGVDSTFLARAAREALGDRAFAVTARSPSFPQAELEESQRLAAAIGIRQEFIETAELDNPDYASNPTDRCYFCKSELFARMEAVAQRLGCGYVLHGAVLDDLNDHRPGAVAARERSCVRAPLQDAGLTKEEVRELSRRWGLPTWNKPSFACLASRFPYGSPITLERLRTVEAAEQFLRDAGFRQFRVRHHDTVARIEVLPEEMPRLLDADLRERLVEELRKLGFRHVAMDLTGFRSGSMNVGLKR